jgi:hypothetical protein
MTGHSPDAGHSRPAPAPSSQVPRRLAQTYPALAGRRGTALARVLLGAGRLAVILDGLDEMAEELRPAALAALSQQACFRLVLLTRGAEMAAAAARGLLEGAAAVEL